MNILRLGYVHLAVTDREAALTYYRDVLGLQPVGEDPAGRTYLKAWDEWDHHSIVLEEGDGGLLKMGWKVRAGALEDVEARTIAFGAATERMAKGDNLAVGDGIRCVTPAGHVAEFYEDVEVLGTETGTLNPPPWPRAGFRGVGVPRLAHIAITGDDIGLTERFYSAIGFHPTERGVPDPNADPIVSFLTCGEQAHDIAILKGPDSRLHHIAFQVDNWNEVLRAGDILSMNDVAIDVGPARHGITRGQTLYFFDPTGNRNEVFAGGYRAGPDMPTITWTADELGRSVFYISREMPERFLTVTT
ncbi:MAG: catechol 2,3-dioxygenase [Actinobacteria bacterium]|nr:catechol 2,3-dioxygenase [Actinomycetota bacterium]